MIEKITISLWDTFFQKFITSPQLLEIEFCFFWRQDGHLYSPFLHIRNFWQD